MGNDIFKEIQNQLKPSVSAEKKLMMKISEEKERKCRMKERRYPKFTLVPIFAAVALIGIGAVYFAAQSGLANDSRLTSSITGDEQSDASSGAEIDIIKKWEEKNIIEKFSSFEFMGNDYSVNSLAPVSAEFIGDIIGASEAVGYDVYTDTSYTAGVEIFELDGFLKDAAIGAKIEGSNEIYPFTNSLYSPDTLGDFISDLSLEKHLSFGSIYYSYFDEDMNYHSVEFSPIERSIIFDMLLSEVTLVNEGERGYGISLMSISCNVDGINCSNLSLAVSEDGYLMTNILATAKSFYIGKDKAMTFVNYILENAVVKNETVSINTQSPDDAADVIEDVETQSSSAYIMEAAQ